MPGDPSPFARLRAHSLTNQQRLRVIAARQHVGGAALLQTEALEDIIAVGREQLEITEALKDVMALTLSEVRTASLEQIQSSAPAHADLLKSATEAGQEQLNAAALLAATIDRALEQVTHLAPEDVSLGSLREIQGQVRAQLEGLHEVLAVARQHARSAEDVARLGRIGANLDRRLHRLQHAEAVDKLTAFGQVSETALRNIMEVQHVTVQDRRAALQRLIDAAQGLLTQLDVAKPSDRRG